MQPLTITVALAAVLGLVALSLHRFIKACAIWKDKSTEPPGPPLIPWVGRVHDLPTQSMWLKFKEWADLYGPLYRTQMLGDPWIIVTDEKIAEDLLVKRAKIYSDRPSVRSLFDSKSTHGSMEYLPMMGRNKYWARQRKFMHAYLTDATNAQYHGVMYHEAKRWLARLIENPDDFAFSLEDMASKIMCQLTWDDPDQSEYCTESAWGLLTQLSPAGPITNIITPLWDLPLWMNPWKQAEHKRHAEQQGWWMERFLTVRSELAKNQARPSFTRTYLEGETPDGKRPGGLSGDYEASSAIGMMCLISIITIAGPIYYFLLAMIYHPEWQAKVQKELDEVCGNRLPELADMPKLPTLRACIKESMRWRPSIPTGVAHEVEADDFYNGYFIPKGARILALEWAILRNKEKYPDPDSYRPERWLESNWPTFQAPLTQYPTVIGMSSFGWGQRTCIGQHLTRDEEIIACGSLLWGFNLSKKRDANGNLIHPPLDKPKSMLIIKPMPFEMAFTPRSEERKREMLAMWKETNENDIKERAEFAKAAEAGVPTVSVAAVAA